MITDHVESGRTPGGYGFFVICEERWPYFGGGLVPERSATHNGTAVVD